MFSKLNVVFIFFNIILSFGSQLYGPHPRILTENGNLVIYAADYRNITLKSSNHGYINVDNENLISLLKDARTTTETTKRLASYILNTLPSNLNRVNELIEGPDGLLRRVTALENNTSVMPTGSSRLMPRYRNILQLSRRVRLLETNMIKIMNLLTTKECTSNPCKNGGECIDIFNGFICRCLESWTGATCESDVNECAKFSGTDLGCQNGATCVNKPGSYECICATGWFGIHCNRRTRDCSSGSPQELCGHGTCVAQNNEAGYKCICDQGWTTNGIQPACTVDVDECDPSKPHHCSINPFVQCINVPGTFYCGVCPQGYSGNGFYCTDINECLINNGGCSILPKVQCTNTIGSRICGPCPPGYIGDGITCSYRGVCQINNGGCHHLAQCNQLPGIDQNFVQCICPNGFTGNGLGPNGCTLNVNVPTSNACILNPCLHGKCQNLNNNSYICVCDFGYTGKNCHMRTNACDSNPCLNGGTCLNLVNRYICQCTVRYTGLNCEMATEVCGGQIIEEFGYLQYPLQNNSNYYQRSSNCLWVIKTINNQVLNVTFVEFNIEKSQNCFRDWLQLHDGMNSAAQLIGRFCGSELPLGGQFTTTGSSLYIWYRTDTSVSKSKFSVKWNSILPICGGVIKVTSHGTIIFPGSPENYSPNRDCKWKLSAPLGKRMQFHFFSLMIGNNPNCSYDYLAIYSGISVMDPLLAKFCNSSHPEPVITTGSDALVHFHSVASGTAAGFQIAYSVIEGIPGCGGVFTREIGEISSPSVDDQYQANLDCEYKIQIKKNSKIKITFLLFALEDSHNCQFDYLAIYEGGTADSPLVGHYCGSNIPPSYTSQSNELFIRFKTDAHVVDDGFKLKYETICSNTFNSPSGVIQSSGYPFASTNNRNCVYLIHQKPGTAIVLNITDISIGLQSQLDFIEVRDGDNENSTLIGKYSGNKSPEGIISTHNYLWIKMITLSRLPNIGFTATYTTIDLSCGGILKESLGIIQSPQHPKVYLPNSKCTWVLSAPPGYVIQLTWINFNIEWSTSCEVDYVSVYENNTNSGSSALIGTYCGKQLPPASISSTNLLTIFFVSDASLSFDGFLLNYNFVDESKTCGGNYFTPTGVIKSPNYPNSYPPNKDCVWVISVPHGQQIMLNVEEFMLEKYLNCLPDYLEIRNGAYASSPLLGKFCGENIPKTIPSHTHNLYLKFHSDNTYSRRGFKIIWDGTTTGCGGILTSPTGQIISPNYPQPYGENAMCLWKISTSAGSILQIIFLDISLENQVLCRLDYVEIFDGIDMSSKSLGRYCSDVQHIQLLTSQNRALIKFRSDISHQDRGFHLKYYTICNNTLKGYSGVIESFNFPNPYPKNQNCTWTIEVPIGNKINISFSHFDLEDKLKTQNECRFDYIKIIETSDYYSSENTLLDKYCGKELPTFIHSTKNQVNIHFVSDSMVHRSGFRLEWVLDGCSGILTRPQGTIETPGYPYEYPNNIVCEWKIQVDFNKSIQLKLGKFMFEKNNYCLYDSLQIFNGPDENAPLIAKICHTDDNGLTATSTSNVMFVKFTSDSSYNGNGFRATYATVPSQCGGIFKAPMGSIHSRNYPQNYKSFDDCQWLIEIQQNHAIHLNFDELDLVATPNCSSHYLKIYDGKDETAPLIHTLCGNDKPNDTIRSTANTLFLRMSANSLGSAKGFLANYTTECGSRIVTSTNGVIDFGDWGIWECTWTIIADEPSKHVSFTITYLDVSINCDISPLKIYDGENSEAPLIGEYCGKKAPPTIVSEGSSLFVNLNYAYGAYIQATYSVISTECGGTLTSLEGYFGSPGYPKNYPMNMECQWNIKLAPGNKVSLNFLEFDLLSSENCNVDYVEVREKDAAGKLIGIFCGNTIPSNITQSNSLWIQFKSGDIGTAKGFKAEYTFTHGNELFGSKGEIASPLYPMPFPEVETDDITWRITVDAHNVILITFKDIQMRSSFNTNCDYYGLEIYDGYDSTAPLITTICSFKKINPIRTTSNVAFIKYFTIGYTQSVKFLLEWIQIDKPKSTKDLSVNGCGSESVIDISNLSYFTLQSPGFPNGYARNLKCEWIFSTVPERHLTISFLTVDLEVNYYKKCFFDNVKVYSGKDGLPNWQLLNTICLSNSTAMGPIHTSNLMKIEFKTDGYINRTGFSALIASECGGTINAPNGVIEVSNSTRKREYKVNSKCEWVINVKAGRTIQATFLDFYIPNTENNACLDYVLLKNGKYSYSPLLGKFCGTAIPIVKETIGNSLYIQFFGISIHNKFKLAFKEVSVACGGHLTLTNSYNSVNISSPNYPNIPFPHTECVWIIFAPPGEKLQLDFIERLDITWSNNCSKAGVELRDGGTIVSRLIDVFCNYMPGTQKSTDNVLYVRFYTDVNDPKNGFKATVSIASCGGVIRGRKGQLTSPFYPSLYSSSVNTVCSWKIIGPIDHFLNITFEDFRFPYLANCSKGNHLVIKEKLLFGNETILAKLCGFKKPPLIQTSSNEITIEMNILQKEKSFKGFYLTFQSSQQTCGGTIETESGIITSPGYPESIPFNCNCEWIIIVPEGRRVTVNILDLDIKSNYYFAQSLTFFNNKNYESHIISVDGHKNVTVVKSSTNRMLVYFLAPRSLFNRGLKLSFNSNEVSICSGNLNQESGVITTPKTNATTYYCEWVRSPNENTPLNQTLGFIIDAPKIGKNTHSCRYSSTIIRITSEEKANVIAELCGHYTEPQILSSPYPITKLTVMQGRFHDRLNFTITYKIYPCGGVLTSSYGSISSPTFPNRYPSNLECTWLIKIEEGQTIKINFTSLDCTCEKDYVKIHNGPSALSPVLGTFCGNNDNRPPFIQSQSNALWITYHTASGGTGKGFNFDYEPVTSGCGGIYYENNRIIQSPNYPKSYPNDAECIWEVIAPNGYHVGLIFIDRFHIEESKNCTNDYIEIFIYLNSNWTSLGKYCGRVQPQTFNSTTERMRIVFRTNSKLQANGFKAKWTFNCGGIFEAKSYSQYLVSPGYPKEYAPNLDCKYIIKASKQFVNIIFKDFVLEESKRYTDCAYDNVTISKQRFLPFPPHYRFPRSNSLFVFNLGVYCGTKLPPPIRTKDLMNIRLRTDKWVNRKGFELEYYLDSCGGSVTEESEISSPMSIIEKTTYHNSLYCVWNITAPSNKVVILRFTFFELEHHKNCQYDYIAVYNGNLIIPSSRLALLCGNITRNLPTIRSTRNTMLVVIKTDSTNHFRGFKAYIQFMYNEKVGCGGTVNLTQSDSTKIIRSPDIDNSGQYVSNLDCHWLIIAPPDEVIELSFNSFHLSPCNASADTQKCTCDFLEVRDGGNPISELIAQLCGHNLPIKITSSGNYLWIRMITDSTESSTGFTITVTKIQSICGPSVLQVSDKKQSLSSPGFPQNYPNNVRCTWILRANNKYAKIEINFNHLELQDSDEDDKCAYDKLEIHDKIYMHSATENLGENLIFSGPKSITNIFGLRSPPTSYIYCGHGIPSDFTSMNNEIIVSFISDSAINKKGFQLNYSLTDCNKNFKTLQGRILNEKLTKDCTVLISVPNNYTISLYIQSFFLADFQSCNSSTMQVHDGNSSTAPQLAKICGYQTPNPIFSRSNQLWINIKSHRKDFGMYDMIYTATNQGRGCGGNIYYSGKFTSPFYPNTYKNNSVCRWDLSVQRGLQVTLKFTVFDLGSVDTCSTDYIELIDIHPITKEETIRTKYCSIDNPALFVASSNYMALRYISSTNNVGNGWIAFFKGNF